MHLYIYMSIHTQYRYINTQTKECLPCAGRSAGGPHVMSIHPSAPNQERSCRAATDTEQLTVSHCPLCHCSGYSHYEQLSKSLTRAQFLLYNSHDKYIWALLPKAIKAKVKLTQQPRFEGFHLQRPRPSRGFPHLQYSEVPGT